MKIVASSGAEAYVREHGGRVWIWLDPHRALVGSYVWLEAHCEPPGASRRTKFTRASRRPHRFLTLQVDGMEILYDFGRMPEPDEIHLDRKGWHRRTHRLEAYWNGSVFVDDPPMPGAAPR